MTCPNHKVIYESGTKLVFYLATLFSLTQFQISASFMWN
jgi:hypothetical protein